METVGCKVHISGLCSAQDIPSKPAGGWRKRQTGQDEVFSNGSSVIHLQVPKVARSNISFLSFEIVLPKQKITEESIQTCRLSTCIIISKGYN